MLMVVFMRLRNVKNKESIIAGASFCISEPTVWKGKWHTYFQNDHPIHLEIGMGKGQFLIAMAQENPNINFIGIERYDSVIARAIEKVPENLPNLVILRCNANLVDEIFDHEIACLYLNFSDPWPKKRHASRRLTSPYFLDKYDSIFEMMPQIIQKTDNALLFSYSLVSYSNHGYILDYVSLDLMHDEEIFSPMTEFEEKFTRLGYPIYYVVVSKKSVNV